LGNGVEDKGGISVAKYRSAGYDLYPLHHATEAFNGDFLFADHIVNE
jgi:hypothetical protein